MTIDNHDNVIFSILNLVKSKKYFIFAIQMAKNKDNHLFKWRQCKNVRIFAIQMAKNKDNHLFKWRQCKNVRNCTRQYGR